MSSDEEEDSPPSHHRSSSSRRKESSSSKHKRRSKRSSRGDGEKSERKSSRRHHHSSRKSSGVSSSDDDDDDVSRDTDDVSRDTDDASHDDDDDDDDDSPPQAGVREENIFTRGIPAPPLVDGSSSRSKKKKKQQQQDSDDDDETSVSEDERRDGLGELIEYQDYDQPLDMADVEDHHDEGLWDQVLASFLKALEVCEWQTLYLIMTRVEKKDLITMIDRDIEVNDEGDVALSIPAFHIILCKAPCGVSVHLLELLGDELVMELCRSSLREDGNTALHLFCANLSDDIPPTGSKEVRDHQLDLLSRLLDANADSLQTPNEQGDSPLHLLVASQAATSSSSSSLSSTSVSVVEQAVSMLLQEVNELAVAQDSSGATPLHVAIAHGAHESILMKLIQRGPLAVQVMDDNGLLPLHYCAATIFPHSESHLACLEALIRAHPAGLTTPTTSHGDVPLHLLISNFDAKTASESLSKAMVKMIVELLSGTSLPPSATSPIAMPNHEKLTPIHCCALFHVPPDITKTIMSHRAAKKASLLTNKFGATALHMAVSQEVIHMDTIKALGMTREAAAAEDRLKRSPLHVAAQNKKGATDQLIHFLYNLYPEATTMSTQRGHLPLHLAAQSQASKQVVQALLAVDSASAQVRNKSSNTPLHNAAKYQADASVVQLLLESHPDAIYVQNQYGNLPLHCATAYQASAEVVSLLLEAWPDGAAMQNRNQDAPLHYAAAYYYTAEEEESQESLLNAMKQLIAAAPAAVLLLNSSGQSPMDRARANAAPDEIIDLLQESADEWTKRASKEQWGSAEDDDDIDNSSDEDESE